MATQTLSTHPNLPVAVVVPPLKDFYATPHRTANLGARTVESILHNAGFAVSFFDFNSAKTTTLALPPELNYLKPFLLPGESGPTAFFTRYRHFGEPISTAAQAVAAKAPKLCCISCFAFCYATQTIELANQIKQLLPDTIVCVGGSGVCSCPEYFLKHSAAIEYALCGEAEVSLLPFINALGTGDFQCVPNLFYRTNHGDIHAPLQRHYTRAKDWTPLICLVHQTRTIRYYSTTLSRGCPYQCAFCSNHLTFGTTLRHADLSQFADRVYTAFCVSNDRAQANCLNFEDDNILLNPEYLLSLCAHLREKDPALTFLAENGLDYRLLTPELIDRLVDTGFVQFNLSLTSVDPDIIKNQKRATDLDHYQSIVEHLESKSIPSVTYFIAGFTDDTIKTIAANLAFLFAMPTTIGISPFYAVPGIAGFTDRTIFNAHPPCHCAGSSCYPWNGSVSTQTLITAFRLARLCNVHRKPGRTALEEELVHRSMKDRTVYTILKSKKRRTIQAVPNLDRDLCDLFFGMVLRT